MMKKAGEILQEARLKNNLSIEEVFEGTKIRPSYIQSIENSDYSMFHSDTTIKGFLRNYASFLGLTPESVIAIYRREQNVKSDVKVLRKWKLKLPTFNISSSVFVIIASVLIVVGVIGFFTYQYVQVSQPPQFEILSPADKFTTTQDKISVTVAREKDQSISLEINNKEITSVDDQGNYFTLIDLVTGDNKIVVIATNGFKKQTHKEITIYKVVPAENVVTKSLNAILRSQSMKDINISYSSDDGAVTSTTIKVGGQIQIVGKNKISIMGPNNLNDILDVTVNQTKIGLLQNTPKQAIFLNPDNSLKVNSLP